MKVGDVVKLKERRKPWFDRAGVLVEIINQPLYLVRFDKDTIIGFTEDKLTALIPIPQEHMEKILGPGGTV